MKFSKLYHSIATATLSGLLSIGAYAGNDVKKNDRKYTPSPIIQQHKIQKIMQPKYDLNSDEHIGNERGSDEHDEHSDSTYLDGVKKIPKPSPYSKIPRRSIASTSDYEVSYSGKIPILMFHKFGSFESRMVCSPNRFKHTLEDLYERGYHLITFEEAASGNYTKIQGKSPAVLTFDDGTEDQFEYLSDGRLDPNTAVGMLEEFKNEHPGYRVTGTFFVNMGTKGVAFGDVNSERKKLLFLANHDYEIGSHGDKHIAYGKISTDAIKRDIESFNNKIQTVIPEYSVKSFAYPFGSLPSLDNQALVDGYYPYTANAWGGVAKEGTQSNLARIEWSKEISPATYLKRHNYSLPSTDVLLLPEKTIIASKGERSTHVLRPHATFNESVNESIGDDISDSISIVRPKIRAPASSIDGLMNSFMIGDDSKNIPNIAGINRKTVLRSQNGSFSGFYDYELSKPGLGNQIEKTILVNSSDKSFATTRDTDSSFSPTADIDHDLSSYFLGAFALTTAGIGALAFNRKQKRNNVVYYIPQFKKTSAPVLVSEDFKQTPMTFSDMRLADEIRLAKQPIQEIILDRTSIPKLSIIPELSTTESSTKTPNPMDITVILTPEEIQAAINSEIYTSEIKNLEIKPVISENYTLENLTMATPFVVLGAASFVPEMALQQIGNVYKGVPNLTHYASNDSQLQTQYPPASWQSDDSGSRWLGDARESDVLRRQDSSLQHGQEGYQGRSSQSTWQQGCTTSSLRNWNAGTSNWPKCNNPIKPYSLNTSFNVTFNTSFITTPKLMNDEDFFSWLKEKDNFSLNEASSKPIQSDIATSILAPVKVMPAGSVRTQELLFELPKTTIDDSELEFLKTINF